MIGSHVLMEEIRQTYNVVAGQATVRLCAGRSTWGGET